MDEPKKKRLLETVATSEFHEYVPADIPVHVDKDYWGGLTLNQFNFRRLNEGIAAPGVPACGLGFFAGAAAKAYYGIDDSPWKPHYAIPNTFQIVNTGCSTKWQWNLSAEETPFFAINLMLESTLMQELAEEMTGTVVGDIEYPTRVGVSDQIVSSLVCELWGEARNNTPLGKVYGETAARFLGVHILKQYSNIKCRFPDDRYRLTSEQMKKIDEYIHACMGKDISLKSMSDVCGVSAYHFSRLFKATTGLSPHRYLVSRRLEKARMLLSTTRLSIGNIAAQVGYLNQSHFTALFKRKYRVTPLQFRQRL